MSIEKHNYPYNTALTRAESGRWMKLAWKLGKRPSTMVRESMVGFMDKNKAEEATEDEIKKFHEGRKDKDAYRKTYQRKRK
jgi:hypothetical protein